MYLDHDIEERISKIAFAYADKGRKSFDVQHLNAAVFYMKELIDHEGGDLRILLPTILLHDIGYAGKLGDNYTRDDVQKAKKEHMQAGAEMAKKILVGIEYFSLKEINEISFIISIHDNKEEVAKATNSNVQLVFEADSLAQIDHELAPPSYDHDDLMKFIERFKTRRVPLFKTRYGLKKMEELLAKYMIFLASH